ncbi:MAG: hypothetical protein Q4G45_07255 [Actinomycetia bacterium]|nr:hypothetical protein [Actinomycetes bacterium]
MMQTETATDARTSTVPSSQGSDQRKASPTTVDPGAQPQARPGRRPQASKARRPAPTPSPAASSPAAAEQPDGTQPPAAADAQPETDPRLAAGLTALAAVRSFAWASQGPGQESCGVADVSDPDRPRLRHERTEGTAEVVVIGDSWYVRPDEEDLFRRHEPGPSQRLLLRTLSPAFWAQLAQGAQLVSAEVAELDDDPVQVLVAKLASPGQVTLWLDAAGRVRQAQLAQTTTWTLTQIDQPVHIEEPSQYQVR